MTILNPSEVTGEALPDRNTERNPEDAAWLDSSLEAAMRGIENEDAPYNLSDLKESFR